jgi:hypothetical protein
LLERCLKSSSACYQLHDDFLLGLFLDPEDEVVCSSAMSVDFQWTAQRYIPEDRSPLSLKFVHWPNRNEIRVKLYFVQLVGHDFESSVCSTIVCISVHHVGTCQGISAHQNCRKTKHSSP